MIQICCMQKIPLFMKIAFFLVNHLTVNKPYFGSFFELFEPSKSGQSKFFSKTGVYHFSYLEGWKSRWKKKDGKTNISKFIGHSSQSGCPISFCTTQTIWTFSCSRVVHSCPVLSGIICIKRLDTSRIYSQQKSINLE